LPGPDAGLPAAPILSRLTFSRNSFSPSGLYVDKDLFFP
jgi:hypothetical protein